MKMMWFTILILLYAGYVVLFYLAGGFANILNLSAWLLVQKMFLVAVPCYIVYLWIEREQLIWLDYHMLYIPFLAWAIAFYLFGEDKGFTNAFVEPQVVGLVAGIYLIRFPLCRNSEGMSSTMSGIGLSVIVATGAFLVSCFVPAVGD